MDPQSQSHPSPVSRMSCRDVSTDSLAWGLTAQPNPGRARIKTVRNQTTAARERSMLIQAIVFGVLIFLIAQLLAPQVFSLELPQTNSESRVAKVMGVLQSGVGVENALSGRESHAYLLQLEANQYLRIAVDQKGVDVAMMLFGPDQKKLAEVSGPPALQGRRVLSAVTEGSGSHRLEVRSRNEEAAAGRYEVQIADLRDATQRDKSFIAGMQAMLAARGLREQGIAESLRESIKKADEAVLLFREAGDSSEEAAALLHVANVYHRMNDFPNSLDYYNKALLLFRAGSNSGGEASALTGIGYVYVGLNDYQKALDALNQSLPLYRALGDRSGEASAIQHIGRAHYLQDDYPKALELYNQALALVRSVNDRSREATVMFSIGQVYYHLGNYQKALDLYSESLSINRALLNRGAEASALSGLGQVYRSLGENAKALDYFDRWLTIARAAGERLNEAAALNNIAEVCVLMGDYQRALDLYNQALHLCRLIGNRDGEASCLNGVGSSYAGLREYQKALDFHGQALPILRAIGNRRREGYTLSQIGNTHLLLGQHQKALDYLNDALAIFRGLSVRSREANSLYTIARVLQARGDLAEARSHSNAAIRLAETFRHEFSGQQMRTSFLASVRDYYELNVDLLMNLHKQRPSDGLEALALQMSERGRARGLLDLLAEANVDIRQGVDPGLLERERSLRQVIDARAEKQTQLLRGKPAPEQVATAAREIESTIAEYQDVQAKIRATSPRYAALTQTEPLSLKQIQEQVLDADTLLLEYALGDKRSYVWAVTQTSINGYELPGRAEIEAAARSFYDLLRRSGDPETRRRGELEDSSSRLSEVLLTPVADQLGAKRLAIVADGALQYVPFGALAEPALRGHGDRRTRVTESPQRSPSASSMPLMLQHEIVSLPSASALAVMRRETKGRALAPKLVAVLADPVFDAADVRVRPATPNAGGSGKQSEEAKHLGLKRSVEETGLASGKWPLPRLLGTRREARTILSLAPAQMSRQALDFEASRENAIGEDFSQYQIVHFATHGLINNRHPELSGLVLSLVDKQGTAQNGFLRLNEIYNLRLPAELVVLSACQTGLGKDVRGEGFIGLTRGFMYAGARRMMASLWQVDDAATSELMQRFYRGVLSEKRLSPAAALRAAQIEMWKRKEWRSPYYWAAFVVQGEWK